MSFSSQRAVLIVDGVLAALFFAVCALYTFASFALSVGALFAGLQVMRRIPGPNL